MTTGETNRITPRPQDAETPTEVAIPPSPLTAPARTSPQSPIANRQSLTDWLLPLLLLLPILWAYVPGGLPLTADSRVHFIRSAEMVHAWAAGILLPRWSANLGVGLGIPLFNYAPPLPYLTTAALHALGLPLEAAFKTMHVLALLIVAYGAYRLVRDPLGRWAGLVGAAAMLYAPVVLRELFIQGNVGQLLAWAFVPWTLWGVQRVFARPGWRSGVALALAFAGATLSHNAVALLLAEIVAAQVLWLAIWLRAGRALLVAGCALFTSLLLTAWFWAPALLEGDFIQLDKIAASSYAERFLTLGELVALSPRLDLRALNPYFPLTLGAVQVMLAVLGVIVLISGVFLPQRRRDAKAQANSQFTIHNSQTTSRDPWTSLRPMLAGFYILLALFGALMALPVSQPLWAFLPFMDLLEFPFRWHGFTLVALGWLGGFAIFAAGRWRPWAAPVAAAIATTALLLSAVVNLYPDKQAPDAWAWQPADVVAYEVKSGAIGTTSLGEFNPAWAEQPLLDTSPYVEDYPHNGHPDRLPADLPAGANAQQIASSVQQVRFAISTTTPITLVLNQLYFPGWTATGGALTPQPITGLMTLAVPAGDNQRITLTYTGTPLERAAGWLSLLAWHPAGARGRLAFAAGVALPHRGFGLAWVVNAHAKAPRRRDGCGCRPAPGVASPLVPHSWRCAPPYHRRRRDRHSHCARGGAGLVPLCVAARNGGQRAAARAGRIRRRHSRRRRGFAGDAGATRCADSDQRLSGNRAADAAGSWPLSPSRPRGRRNRGGGGCAAPRRDSHAHLARGLLRACATAPAHTARRAAHSLRIEAGRA